MAVGERILMGPGPSNASPGVRTAAGRPLLGHLDPEFLAILDETCSRLRLAFGTTNALTFPISGTGSAGMEACIANLVTPGSVVVVGVNGVFGGRMAEVARRYGAEVVVVEAPWGTPLDPAALVAAHPAPDVIAVVHAETSTGVRNDVAPLGESKGDALLLVDTVTSLGGISLEVDAWGIDVAYAGTQKCLGVPPGLAPVTFSERARQRLVDCRSWYLDVSLIAAYVEAGSARAYHHTAPVSMIAALHAGLGELLDEGLGAAHERHHTCGDRLQAGLEARGMELLATPGHRLPQLTSVGIPDGIDDSSVRRDLLHRYGIEIGGGLGEHAGRAWRIGCMGHTAQVRNVELLLTALDDVAGTRPRPGPG